MLKGLATHLAADKHMLGVPVNCQQSPTHCMTETHKIQDGIYLWDVGRSDYLQEKRAPKKAPGALRKAGEDGKTQAELMEDDQLPKSLKPMPVCFSSSQDNLMTESAAICTDVL